MPDRAESDPVREEWQCQACGHRSIVSNIHLGTMVKCQNENCRRWWDVREVLKDSCCDETSGQRFRRAREMRRRSLRSVADDAGVSPSTLSRWENGKGEPVFSHVARVAHALNISLDWLAGEMGNA